MNRLEEQTAQKSGLFPYHLIDKGNEGKYVYFLERDCAFCIEGVAFELLRLALDSSLEDAADHLGKEGCYLETEIAKALHDAFLLRDSGFMQPPVNTLPKENVERQLKQRSLTPQTGLELALAESCNLACVYCYCSSVRDIPNEGLMSEDVAQKAIDWLFNASRNATDLRITLFGGEPLINKSVFKFIMDYSDSLASKRGKKIHYSMTTNGTLLDDMVIDYIKKHNFGLMVSLDGPPELHNAQCPMRDGAPSFNAAIQGIRKLMQRRKRVTVRCTMTNARPNMLGLVHFFENCGFSRIVLGRAENPPNPSPWDCSEADKSDFDRQEHNELLPYVFEALNAGRIPAWFPYTKMLSEPEPDPDTIKPLSIFHCGACRGVMTVGADGHLYPCHRFVGMSAFVIGHIDDGPDQEKIQDFWRRYDAAVDQDCSQCWARRRCKRPCPWMVANQDGSFRRPNPDDCNRIKHWCEEGIHMQWRMNKEFPEIVESLSTN